MRALIITLILVVSFNTTLQCQSDIVEMEYYVDLDPGIGLATPITGFTMAEQVIDYASSFVNTYTVGLHVIGVRTKDSEGLWSHTSMSTFRSVETPPASEIVAGEYFIGEDPGLGAANAMSSITPDAVINDWATQFEISVDVGIHVIGMRVLDDDGKWSHTRFGTVRVVPAPVPTQLIMAVEYVWDTDDGFGESGMIILDTPVNPLEMEVVGLPVPADFEIGSVHHLGIRSLDTEGLWSHTVYCEGDIGLYELASDTLAVDTLVCEEFITPVGVIITTDSMFTELSLTDNDILQAFDYTVDVFDLQVQIAQVGETLIGPPGLDSYQWLDCDNDSTAIQSATESTFIPSSTGNYALQVTMMDCTAHLDCFYFISSGLEDETLLESMIDYYPNPMGEVLVIELKDETEGAIVELIDTTGRIVLSTSVNPGVQEITLPNMVKGFYLIRFSTDFGVYTDCMVKL